MTAARPLFDDQDPTERLSADDQATQREAQFLTAALARQARKLAAPGKVLGVCANCGAACLPQAVYCDEDCRADDEARQLVLRRQGRAR